MGKSRNARKALDAADASKVGTVTPEQAKPIEPTSKASDATKAKAVRHPLGSAATLPPLVTAVNLILDRPNGRDYRRYLSMPLGAFDAARSAILRAVKSGGPVPTAGQAIGTGGYSTWTVGIARPHVLAAESDGKAGVEAIDAALASFLGSVTRDEATLLQRAVRAPDKLTDADKATVQAVMARLEASRKAS